MGGYKSFGEFLEQRDAAIYAAPTPPRPDARRVDPEAGSPPHYDPLRPDALADQGQVGERSIFAGLFKSPFKAVNPARAVSPSNSRLLASPFRQRRLKSQVVGR